MSTLPGYGRVEKPELVVGLLSGTHVINHMYTVLLPPLFGVLAGEFEVGLAALGAATGVLGIAGMLGQLPYGYLADNYDRLVAFLLNTAISTAGAFVTALAPSFEWLLVGQVLFGVGVAGHHPAHYPMIVAATTEERRGQAFGVYEFAGLIGFAATPVVISAVLGAGLSWRYAVGAIGALGAGYTLLATGFLLTGIDPGIRQPTGSEEAADADGPETTEEPPEPPATPGERVRRGVDWLLGNPSILAMAVFAFVAGFVNWGFVSYVVVLLTDGYGVTVTAANLVLTGVFVFSGIWVLYGGVIIDKVARGPDTVITGSFGLSAPLVAVVATLAVSPVVAVVVILLIGAAQGPSVPAVSTVTEAFSAESNLGRNMAIITVGTYAGNGVAPPVIGGLIEGADLRVAFLAIAIIGLVGSFLMLGIARRYGDPETLRDGAEPASAG